MSLAGWRENGQDVIAEAELFYEGRNGDVFENLGQAFTDARQRRQMIPLPDLILGEVIHIDLVSAELDFNGE